MSFQKNVFSYSIWMIFIMCNCAVFSFAGMLFARMIPIPVPVAALGLTITFFGFLFLIYFFTGFLCRNKTKIQKTVGKDGIRKQLIWEGIAVILILVIGLVLRIYLLPKAGETAAYFDVAKVSDENTLMVLVQNSVYYYLCVLRGVFILIGNHWMAGIWLQIVLQLISGMVFYFAVRKLTGVSVAVTVLLYTMLSPSGLQAALNYSPQMLYLMFWTSGMLFVALYLNRSTKGEEKEKAKYCISMWFYALLLGMIIGFLIYTDISGLLLLIPVVFLPMVKRNVQKTVRWFGRMLIIFTGTIAGFFGFIGLDSLLSATDYRSVLDAWIVTFQPEGVDMLTVLQNSTIEVMILIIIMSIGVFSFCRRKKGDILALWILMTLVMAALYLSGITASNMNGRELLLILMAVVAAISVKELFWKETEMVPEPANNPLKIIDIDAAEKEKPHFLENPLPLPKKHIKRTMDFAFVPESSLMQYDLDVSENDDFDV